MSVSAPGGSATSRPLTGEKAKRIIEAMRNSVARRGTAGSTFDRVAREAGVSRGLLHYYFGTKEQLLVEAVRHDCDVRLERLKRQLAGAKTLDRFVGLLAETLQSTLSKDPEFVTIVFELFTLARRNEGVAREYAELQRRMRQQLAGSLAAADAERVVRLQAPPEAVAEVLLSLADGLALRMLTEPARDYAPTLATALSCARSLLSG